MSPQGSPDFRSQTERPSEQSARKQNVDFFQLGHSVVANSSQDTTVVTNNSDETWYLVSYGTIVQSQSADSSMDIYTRWDTRDADGNMITSFVAQGDSLCGHFPAQMYPIPPGGDAVYTCWNDADSDADVYTTANWTTGDS